MSYAPKNVQIFTAAFAGTLAGMGLSDRIISNSDPASYAGLASVAGAFAQAVDTAWTDSRATTLLDIEAIQSNCAAYWQDRSPIVDATNTNAATHAAAALTILATITASESYYAAQGITPPAIPGGTSGGFPNVTNLTALGAINWATNGLAEGYQYYVQTQRSFWILAQTSTETVNGNTVIAATGGGRWLRNKSFAHPSWLVVNNWYIDATNGNDENDGQAAVSGANNVGPLKTYAELAMRWNGGNIRPTQIVVNYPTVTYCRVYIRTSLPDTDPVYGACHLGTNACLWFVGQVETVLYTGTFSSVTARNPATNSATILGDTLLNPTTYLNRRWRVTTAARVNTMGFIAKDLGGNTFRSSCPQLPYMMRAAQANSWPIINGGVQQDPQVNDTYQIEQLTTISLGDFSNINIQGNPSGGGSRIVFGELAIRQGGFAGTCITLSDSFNCSFYSCEVSSYMILNGGILNELTNCSLLQGVYMNSGLWQFVSGMASNSIAGASGVYSIAGTVVLAGAFMCQAVNFKGCGLMFIDGCVFDCPANTTNNGGCGVVIGKAITAGVQQPHNMTTWCSIETRIWGSGNAGSGIFVGAGCQLNYAAGIVAAITITGTGGDFNLNGNTTASPWDQTASAGAGAYLARRNCTWANLAATVATTGFGGFANDVPSGARVASSALAA